MRSPAPDRALPPALHSALASAHLEARRLGSKLKSCTHDSSYKTRVIRREARGRVYVNVRLALARPLAQRRTLLGLGARGSARTRARLAPLTQARGSASAGAPRLSAMRARVLVCGSVPRRMLDAVASGRASRVLVCGSVPRRMRWHRGACACAHAVCGVRCATRPAAAPSSRAPRSLVPLALLSLGPPSSSAASHAAWARAQRRTLLGLGSARCCRHAGGERRLCSALALPLAAPALPGSAAPRCAPLRSALPACSAARSSAGALSRPLLLARPAQLHPAGLLGRALRGPTLPGSALLGPLAPAPLDYVGRARPAQLRPCLARPMPTWLALRPRSPGFSIARRAQKGAPSAMSSATLARSRSPPSSPQISTPPTPFVGIVRFEPKRVGSWGCPLPTQLFAQPSSLEPTLLRSCMPRHAMLATPSGPARLAARCRLLLAAGDCPARRQLARCPRSPPNAHRLTLTALTLIAQPGLLVRRPRRGRPPRLTTAAASARPPVVVAALARPAR